MRGLIGRLVRWAIRTFGAFIERFIAVGLIPSGVILAAYTFLSLMPLLIVVIAYFPTTVADAVTATMRRRLGLGGSEAMVRTLIGSRDELRGSASVVSALVALVSATSFTRALQRIYETAWGVPRLGLRGSVRGVVWLMGLVAYVTVIGSAVRFTGSGGVGPPLRALILGLGAVGLWWWTPYVLLLGRVRLRALLPSGLITGAVMIVLGAVSAVVVPRTLETNQREFGTIGAVFAIESWLVIVGCALVAAAVVGAVLAQLDGPLGRLARGTADPDGWRRSPPSSRTTRRRATPASDAE